VVFISDEYLESCLNDFVYGVAVSFQGLQFKIAEMMARVTDEALQWRVGYGYMDEYDVERFYRDAKIVEIYEGTKEIEKITIAREVLGRNRKNR
jgi:alkylation response protein AidB-like acyl-CoA dehydrogenase